LRTIGASAVAGAISGGAFGGVDAALAGQDWRQAAIQGAVSGFILGAAGGALAGQWKLFTHAAQLTLKMAFYAFDAIATGAGVVESWFNGNGYQAGFRLFVGLGGFALLRKIPQCFPAGTKVLIPEVCDGEHSGDRRASPNRWKNIEAIRPGDLVLAFDAEHQRDDIGRVTKTYERRATQLREIRISVDGMTDQVLKPTPEHPFWIAGKGWTPAANIEQGDAVRLSEGLTGRVLTNEQVEHDQEITVYNFEVADHHSYFVAEAEGHHGVLVHNADYQTLLAGIRAAYRSNEAHYNARADSLEDALNAVKAFLGSEALEMPPGLHQERYVDPPTGTEKYFRIEPPDGKEWYNREYHVKFFDWTRGHRGSGGISGHITFPEADYWRFLDLFTAPPPGT
jgi:hypothetical protein